MRIDKIKASLFYIILNKRQDSFCAFTGMASTLLLNGCASQSNFRASMDPELERGLKVNKKSKLQLT